MHDGDIPGVFAGGFGLFAGSTPPSDQAVQPLQEAFDAFEVWLEDTYGKDWVDDISTERQLESDLKNALRAAAVGERR